MAEVAAPARPHTSFERDSVPSAAHRAALLSLLGAHAVPVWGWGERGAYAELVMDGPSLEGEIPALLKFYFDDGAPDARVLIDDIEIVEIP